MSAPSPTPSALSTPAGGPIPVPVALRSPGTTSRRPAAVGCVVHDLADSLGASDPGDLRHLDPGLMLVEL